MHISIYGIYLTLASSILGKSWEYYVVKTGIVLVIVFTIAVYKCKYRQCNELSL